MAIGLKVLMNVKDKLEELFDESEIAALKTEGELERYQMALKKIYNGAVWDLMSTANIDGELRNAISYFKDSYMTFEEMQSKKGYGFGITKPDEIREAVLSWNRAQSANLLNLLGAFDEEAAKRGVTGLKGLFSSVLSETGRIETEQFKYPVSIYELRKALDAVDNVFTYGQKMLFYDDSVGVSTYLPAKTMEHAEEYPEDFLIFEVYYD